LRQQANARLLAAYQMTYPGKKLGFMGNELAQTREWSERGELDWWLLAHAPHAGQQRLARDLNRLYRERAALHELDHVPEGFAWVDCHDADQSVLSYRRIARDGSFVVVVLNFTPIPRTGYRIGVPGPGAYREILNTDSHHYGGTDLGNGGSVSVEPVAHLGQPWSLALTLPPLAGLVLGPD
jgi:1,4-alpha-glucan branching enzyme